MIGELTLGDDAVAAMSDDGEWGSDTPELLHVLDQSFHPVRDAEMSDHHRPFGVAALDRAAFALGLEVRLAQPVGPDPMEAAATANAFCPTGEGGGIDPTCGKGGKAKPKSWSEVKVPSLDSWKDLPAEKGFLYHATNLENAEGIGSRGMQPKRPWFGTDQRIWPDGSTDRRSYFTPRPSTALAFAPEHGKSVLLRVRSGKVKNQPHFKEESGTRDMYTKKRVKPKGLEILTTEGWVRLDSLQEPTTNTTTTTNAPPTQKASAAALYDISDEYTRAEARDIARAVLAGYNNDKSSAAVSKVLQKQLGLPAAQADVLAQTELTRVAAADQLSDARIAADESGKKARVRFITGVGSCPICTALHGKVYNLEDAQDVIPVHPNCTCRWQAL